MKNRTLHIPFTFAANQKPIIRGQLHGYDPQLDADLVLLAIIVAPTVSSREQKEINIQADGRFFMVLDYAIAPRQVWLKTGDYYFGELRFSKEIVVDIDLNQLKKGDTEYYACERVTFSGPDSSLTNYVNLHNTYLHPRSEALAEEMTTTLLDRATSPEDKIPTLRRQQAEAIKILQHFIEKHPSEHTAVLINDNTSDFYSQISAIYFLAKQAMPKILLQEICSHEPQQLSNEGVDYYRHLCFYLKNAAPTNDLEVLEVKVLPKLSDPIEQKRLAFFLELNRLKIEKKDYNQLLFKQESSFFTRKYQTILNTEKTLKYHRQIEQLSLNDERKALLIACGGIEDPWKQAQYLNIMLPKIKTSWVQHYLKSEWEASKVFMKNIDATLAKAKTEHQQLELGVAHGTLENGTTFYAPKYLEVTELLAALQTSLPNKALILDIWATWCGPCISDMKQKSSTINKTKLKAMGVEVVYLCSSNRTDIETWKRKVTELDMGPSLHLYMNDTLSAKIMTTFKRRGFPSYIFIDREGRFQPDVVHRMSNIDFNKIKKHL